MNDIGANEEGDVTEPFEHVTYVSFRRVDPVVDPSEVTSTVERDVLSGDVDPDALRPTGTMKASPVASAAPAAEADLELDASDLVFEMESLAARAPASTSTFSQRTTRSSMPPPLPPRASRPSIAPVTVRASLPPTERAPEPPPTQPMVAPLQPMLLVEPDPPMTVPSAAMTIRSFPPPPPPPQAAFPPPPPLRTLPLPPVFVAQPMSMGPAYVPPSAFNYETPSTAPVAMSVSFGREAPVSLPPPSPKRAMRLSPAALASLVVLFVGSAIAFGTVLVLRSGRVAAVASAPPEARTAESAPAASPAPSDAVVPTIAPAALPSVVVGVDALPKASVTDPDMTLLTPPASAKGHRVFVDGRVIGTGGSVLKTKCGDHTVKVGSAGKPRLVNLPCGGELALD